MYMEENTFTAFPGETQVMNMVRKGFDTVIYEGGWWMTRHDYDVIWEDEKGNTRRWPRSDVGISRDETTRQLKIFFIPTDFPRYPTKSGEPQNNIGDTSPHPKK